MMGDETRILAAAMADRSAYEMMENHIERDTFTAQGEFVWKAVKTYYGMDSEAKGVDRPLLLAWIDRNVNQGQNESIRDYIALLPEEISSPNVVNEVLGLKRSHVAQDIARTITLESEPSIETVDKLFDKYRTLLLDARGQVTWSSWDNIIDSTSRENAIPLAPSKLNAKLRGGAIPGDHILIFGRPEVGKSLFSINMAAKAAKLGYKVMYLGNEEPIVRSQMRMICNLANATYDQFEAHPEAVTAKAMSLGAGNIRAEHLDPGDLAQVETRLRAYNPDIVFIDQLTGLDHPEANEVSKLLKLARGFRSLLARYECVGVSICQAGDRTERSGQEAPAYLGMGDVYSSRTGIPAMCDLMIGVGVNDELRNIGQRAITLPKNKLGGDHGSFIVGYDEPKSRVV